MGQDSFFKPTSDAVYNRIGNEGVIIHMKTNRIYDLNRTAVRFWELLSTGHNQVEIKQIMLQEFEVSESQLSTEMETLLTSLENEQLIETDSRTN
jgi:hypothetical protein